MNILRSRKDLLLPEANFVLICGAYFNSALNKLGKVNFPRGLQPLNLPKVKGESPYLGEPPPSAPNVPFGTDRKLHFLRSKRWPLAMLLDLPLHIPFWHRTSKEFPKKGNPSPFLENYPGSSCRSCCYSDQSNFD